MHKSLEPRLESLEQMVIRSSHDTYAYMPDGIIASFRRISTLLERIVGCERTNNGPGWPGWLDDVH